MAMKDWKKEPYENWWTNTKTGQEIAVEKGENEYFVLINGKSMTKKGMSKSQALKFAKSYMRKH